MSRTTIAAEACGPETEIRRAAQRQVLSALWNAVATPVKGMMAAYAERRGGASIAPSRSFPR